MQYSENNLYSATQIRQIEANLFEQNVIGSYALMERAGAALYAFCRAEISDTDKIMIICGPGNNGGDGYVLARLFHQEGVCVALLSAVDFDCLSGDAAKAKDDWLNAGGQIISYQDSLPEGYDLIVDAVLGTGLQRALEGQILQVIEQINAYPANVLAVDIPSGLTGETGQALPTAVQADHTLTFIGYKLGLFNGEAANFCGEIQLDTLDVTDEYLNLEKALVRRLDAQTWIDQMLSPRPAVCHKGDFGHVLSIGGDHGMSGAIRMSAEAAARVGAGLVSVFTREEHAAQITAACPVLMVRGVEQQDDFPQAWSAYSVLAIGPGLGQSAWSQFMFQTALKMDMPMVIDADGLNLLVQNPVQRQNWILTPHPGEASRLLGISAKDVQADRLSTIQRLQQKYKGVVVLKGRGTLIADGNDTYLCDAGNPGMASGGMGDVLTGVIAGLIAQGLSLTDAATTAVCIHAKAGSLAAGNAPRGLLATDLMPYLRKCVNP